MEKNFTLIFDEVILKQLKHSAKNKTVENILQRIFDTLEEKGSAVGKLLDSQLFIYEIKVKRPPIRLYFKPSLDNNEIYIFEYEMKTSLEKQEKTLFKLRKNILKS